MSKKDVETVEVEVEESVEPTLELEDITEDSTESKDDFVVIEPDMNKAFITVYENAVDDEWCDKVVKFFDENEDRQQLTEHEDYRCFKEVNLFDEELVKGSKPTTDSSKLSVEFMHKIYDYIESYRRFYNISFFPSNAACEEIRIKKYEHKENHFFNYHVDVGDHASARRFLVILLYLNDVEEGGQTVFPEYGITIPAKKGSIAIFPPFWTHPHLGEQPKSNDKYIMGTYMHYLDGSIEEVDETSEKE